MITLVDPEGYPVNLMYGASPAEVGKLPEKMVLNTESEKPRQRHFSRFKPGPAAVYKVCYISSFHSVLFADVTNMLYSLVILVFA
jgi:hypothetical protein